MLLAHVRIVWSPHDAALVNADGEERYLSLERGRPPAGLLAACDESVLLHAFTYLS